MKFSKLQIAIYLIATIAVAFSCGFYAAIEIMSGYVREILKAQF